MEKAPVIREEEVGVGSLNGEEDDVAVTCEDSDGESELIHAEDGILPGDDRGAGKLKNLEEILSGDQRQVNSRWTIQCPIRCQGRLRSEAEMKNMLTDMVEKHRKS
ncbi:hypothetical protein MKX01_038576 [Papaver californicum]|nr:hypothetical protein MKX01_038576 [Papaver californicum]